MNTYRVKVRSRLDETFEVEAESEDEAAEVWFDGTVVYHEADDPEVLSIVVIDRAESDNRWVSDGAAGAL